MLRFVLYVGSVKTVDYKIRSKSYDWKDISGKYLARTVRPPKYRPSSSRTVFQAPTGPEKRTKIRTASSGLGGVGYTGCTTTLSTVPFLEHSSPVEKKKIIKDMNGKTIMEDRQTNFFP